MPSGNSSSPFLAKPGLRRRKAPLTHFPTLSLPQSGPSLRGFAAQIRCFARFLAERARGAALRAVTARTVDLPRHAVTPPVAAASCRQGASDGGMRRRTTRIGAPQHGQVNGGRGFTQAVLGITLSTTCNSAISVLLLGCRKP